MNFTYQLKDKTHYVVRRANEHDFEQLLAVQLSVAEEDEVTVMKYSEAKEKILTSKERLRELLKTENKHFIYLVGIVNNQIVGFCDIHIGKTERTKHTAELGRNVLKEWRRTWAGKFLQISAIEFIRNLKSIEKISLHILSNNLNSLMSCQANGFKLEVKRDKEIKLNNNTYADLMTYVLYLKN